jgi:hypothetical protein
MKKKSNNLLEDMMKKRGYIYPSYSMLAETDSEFLKTYNELCELVMLRKRKFPEKVKELFFLNSGLSYVKGLRHPPIHAERWA